MINYGLVVLNPGTGVECIEGIRAVPVKFETVSKNISLMSHFEKWQKLYKFVAQ